MSTSLVIVAIPEEQDRVWQVSSEQVPHLTLLYLGDDVTQVQHVDQIEQFVEHAVTLSEHGPFYLDVKRRGVLGPNEADVLFFNEKSWNLKWIKQFRGQLLQNDAVRTAFDSAAQFGAVQEWLPHLTLGSPDAPAQPIPKDGFDHPFYSVCFDRIAVWSQEYAGPEFLLEWPDREFDGDLAVAYSDTKKAELIHYAMNGGKPLSVAELGEQFVEHHGVKGMKWGVRKEPVKGGGFGGNQALKAALLGPAALLSPKFRKHTSSHTQAMVAIFGMYSIMSPKVHADLIQATKKVKLEKADSEWEKGLKDGSAMVAVHNATSNHFNANIASVNAKHPGDFKKDTKNFDDPSTWGPKYKSYMKDIDSLTKDSIKNAANELHLKNPSGTKEVEIHQGPSRQPGDYLLTVKSTHGGSDAGKAGSAGSGTANFGSGKVGSAGSGSSRFKHSAMEEVLQHAANPALDVKVNFTIDAEGRVTGFTFPDDAGVNAVHSDTLSNGAAFVDGLVHASVLDNANVAAQIKAKIQSILDDVTGDGDGDVKLFGDPLVRTKIQSVLQDFYQDPNVDNAIVYDALGEKFLEHFGVKGMRWGVRKAEPIKSKSGHTIIRGKAKVNVEGGGGHPAHPDAIKVAEAKTKLKKSGAAALSNEELRTVANRLQLEGQVHTLIKTKGKKFVDRHLEEQSNQLVRTGIREGAKRALKRGAQAAAVAAI